MTRVVRSMFQADSRINNASPPATSNAPRTSCATSPTLSHDARGAFDVPGGLANQQRAHALPIHQPHDEVDQSLVLVHGIDGHDVRMRELRGRLRLANETRADIRVEGKLRRQDLDRD